MNGKEIILGMTFVGSDLIQEAECGSFCAETEKRVYGKTRRPLLIAAMIGLMLLLMGCTVAAVAYTQGWFASYFSAQSEAPLSEGQISFIAEHEQMIQETQVHNDWTVELKSAMTDGNTAYIILSVRAPEGVKVGNEIVDGIVKTRMTFENNSMKGDGNAVTCSAGIASAEGNYWYQTGSSWAEDNDGLDNTGDIVYQLTFNKFYANQETSITDPFGPDIDFYIHLENIALEYDDEEYRQELLNGKYKGQTDVMFTPEETEKLIRVDVISEGTWDFIVNFAESEAGVELLSVPVTTMAFVTVDTGPDIDDYVYTTDAVTLDSFQLKPLSAAVFYEYDGGVNLTDAEHPVYAVMKDGSRIALWDRGSGGVGCSLLEAEAPVVAEEVDHILLTDGTKIPMPEA